MPGKNPRPLLVRLPFLIAAIGVVTIVTWLAAWQYVQQSLVRTAGEALTLGAYEIALKFDRMVFERYGDLRIISVVLSGHVNEDPVFVQRYLETMRDTYESYHWLAVADRDGRLVASTSTELPLGTDVSGTPWFREVQARAASQRDATLLGGVDAFLTEKGAPDAIALSRVIYDDRGEFGGVVTSRIAIPVLEAIAVETLRTLQGQNSTLAEIEYQVIANDGVAYIDSDLLHKGRSNFNLMNLPSFELARQGRSGFVEETHLRRQVDVLTGYSRTRGWGQPDPFQWIVLVRIPTASLVQPIQRFHLKIGTAGLVILVPIFYLLIWMQRRLLKEWRIAQAERVRATSAQAQYHLLLQTTDQGIFGLDRNGRCTFINRAAARMLGYDPKALLGEPLHERLHEYAGRACSVDNCVLLAAMSARKSAPPTEQVFRRKDGSLCDVECSAFLLTEENNTTDSLFTFMDIAERKQRTQALLHYQARLQSLAVQLRKTDELVRQRLATELHDNLAQTLALCQMKLASLARTMPPTVATAVAPVTALLKEALGVTRRLMSDLRPPTLGDDGDLATAVQWVTAKLGRHGLTVRVVDDGRPKPLDPDVLRIAHQSLHELLFNVLKHAHTTEATVRLRRVGAYLALQVRDRGVGFQTGGQQVPTQEGGFGLFNLREQLRGIGGHLRVSSVPGGGSRVTILLPLQTPSRINEPAAEDAGGEGAPRAAESTEARAVQIRILLVDDHQILRQGLRSMIESEPGFEVVAEAMDGEMAVDLTASVRPDVVLMDINMPKLNGVEATRRIKHRFPDISVIGLSMHEDPKLEQLMYEAGASVHLSKGTAFNLVCDAIRQVRSNLQTPSDRPAEQIHPVV